MSRSEDEQMAKYTVSAAGYQATLDGNAAIAAAGTFYDNTLKDEYSHAHVRAAREAGRAWAEREYEAAEGASRTDPTAWYPTDADARPLVSFPPDSEVEDQVERELELAEICNSAARKRWAELCG